MHINRVSYLWLAIIVLAFSSCSNNNLKNGYDVRLKDADSTVFAKPSYNDQFWKQINGTNHQQVFWLRYHIDLKPNEIKSKLLGLQVVGLGSFELYWDGQLIGKNGRVGNNPGQEQIGRHRTYYVVPDALARTKNHIVALRISNYNANTSFSFFNIRIDGYQKLLTQSLNAAIPMAILAGIFFIGLCYYVLLYVVHRREKQFFLFALLCLFFFLLIAAEYMPVIWSYPYPVQTIRLKLIGVLTFSISLLIPVFLNAAFEIFHKRWFLLINLICLALIYLSFWGRYDLTAQLLSLNMWLMASLITLMAIIKKQNGSKVIFFVVVGSGLIGYYLYYDYSLFLGFALLMIGMLYLLALRAKEMDLAYQRALLISERLKTELLKKSIQPHFLMNTLTSLIDWIEESPQKGIAFIHALANEFEILANMTEQKLVPITEEIALCKAHLEIMRYRKEINYSWEEDGIDLNESIPPAVIHTMLENGITHSTPLANGTMRFSLSFTQLQNKKIYRLQTTAKNRTVYHGKIGTGLQYVEARLNESYGSNWQLQSAANPDGWCTTIEIIAE